MALQQKRWLWVWRSIKEIRSQVSGSYRVLERVSLWLTLAALNYADGLLTQYGIRAGLLDEANYLVRELGFGWKYLLVSAFAGFIVWTRHYRLILIPITLYSALMVWFGVGFNYLGG